jgi:nucleoside-diphosphate-sugar epimerase
VVKNLKILLTGAFGIVGTEVLNFLIERKYEVRVFEINTFNNWLKALNYKDKAEIIWGDIRNKKDVEKAVKDIDIVIHLAAIIPPLADRKPDFAYQVNVEGTKNIISAIERVYSKVRPNLIYSSSIAIYGDRRDNPLIKLDDEPNPNPDDYYAQQKLQCEKLIKESNLDWVIYRLTYIVSPDKLNLDPIMYDMPLDTKIEICNAKDTALALVNSIENKKVWGKIMHIAGGKKCRTTYKEYLQRMFKIFGIGFDDFPESAFSKRNFHCGYMKTKESQHLLNYQNHTIEDYYDEVEKKIGYKSYFYKMFRYLARKILLQKSEYYQHS